MDCVYVIGVISCFDVLLTRLLRPVSHAEVGFGWKTHGH